MVRRFLKHDIGFCVPGLERNKKNTSKQAQLSIKRQAVEQRRRRCAPRDTSGNHRNCVSGLRPVGVFFAVRLLRQGETATYRQPRPKHPIGVTAPAAATAASGCSWFCFPHSSSTPDSSSLNQTPRREHSYSCSDSSITAVPGSVFPHSSSTPNSRLVPYHYWTHVLVCTITSCSNKGVS